MTQPEHSSAEQISDLLAGVLPAAEAMDVNAHLASCEACRDDRDALLDLTALLADEGSTDLAMPPDVVAAIGAAIEQASAERASIERAADVPSLERAQRASGRQPGRWLAGAAAAVVVVAIGFAGIRALPDQGAGSAADSAAPHPAATQGGGLLPEGSGAGSYVSGDDGAHPPIASMPPRWQIIRNGFAVSSSAEVPDTARRLSRSPDLAVAPSVAGCARPLTGGLTTVVQFHGQTGVLTITRATRLVTIYDCATATKTLFVTSY